MKGRDHETNSERDMVGKKVTFNLHEIPQPLRPFQIKGRDCNMAEKALLKTKP